MEDNVLYEREQVTTLFRQAQQEGNLLEITFQDDERTYGARVLAAPGAGLPIDHDALVISPLEPSTGNVKIRRQPELAVRLNVSGLCHQAKVAFRRVIPLGEQQGIVVSLPRVVSRTRTRNHPRTRLPLDVMVRMTVEKRGAAPINGLLRDISEVGLSFSCQASGIKPQLCVQDRLQVTIHARPLGSGSVALMTTVRSVMRARNPINSSEVWDRYGLELAMATPAQALQLTRLARLVGQRYGST